MKNIIIILVLLLVGILAIRGIYGLVSTPLSSSMTATSTVSTTTSMGSMTGTPPATQKTVSSQTTTTHVYVDIAGYAFTPQALTIKKGTTVTWTNRDAAVHNVIADNGGPTSPNLSKGQSYSFTFKTAGIYGYHCSFHPNMTGTIIVK